MEYIYDGCDSIINFQYYKSNKIYEAFTFKKFLEYSTLFNY